MFTDIAEYVESGCVSLPPISTNDHCVISVPSVNSKRAPNYSTIRKRNITPASKVAVTRELSSLSWSNLFNANTADEKVDILHNTINSILEKLCPVRSVRVPSGKPVLTSPLIRKLQRAKQRAHKKNNWKFLAKMLSSQLAKQTSDNVIETVQGRKSWWKNLKQLTGDWQNARPAPFISMNGNWLSHSQFVEQLNTHHLDGHQS
jgi:hypothetical protein